MSESRWAALRLGRTKSAVLGVADELAFALAPALALLAASRRAEVRLDVWFCGELDPKRGGVEMSMGEAALLTLVVIAAGSLVHVFFERPARFWIRRRLLGRAPRAVPSAT